MGITVAVTRAACAVVGGNQSITTADLRGQTPLAAWFIAVRATADGTAANHAGLSLGAATSSTQRWVVSILSEHGVGTTDTYRRGATDECVMIMDLDGSVNGEADFVAFIADGCTINWGNAPGSAWLLTVVFFAGSDLSAKADIVALGNQDVETNKNDVGFEPDVLLTACGGQTFSDTATTELFFSHGMVANKLGVPQYTAGHFSWDGQATSAIGGLVTDDYGSVQTTNSATLWSAEFGSFDSGGFSVWPRGGNSGDEVGFLALKFDDAVNFKIGSLEGPDVTGSESITDSGFEPQFVMVGLTEMALWDTIYDSGEPGTIGISTFDQDDTYCNSVQDEDGQGTTDTQSLSNDQAIDFPQDDGTTAYSAAFVSFDPTGWTWTFDTVKAGADKWFYLAIEKQVTASLRYRTAYKSQDD